MQPLIYAGALLLPAISGAQPYQFDLTGDQFAALLAQQPVSEREYRARDRAYAYLDGVKDTGIGKTWCPPQPHKTFELAYDAADYIRRLSDNARKSNAAQLLLTYLAGPYPCGRNVKLSPSP